MIDAEQATTSLAADPSNPFNLDPDLTAAQMNVKFFYRGDPANIAEALAADTAKNADAIKAVVNQARWIAECPDGDGGAQYASREDRRFMCLECLNASIGGLWRPVVWPDDVAGIEAVLEQRREQANQNWLPTETVADLQAENEAHA